MVICSVFHLLFRGKTTLKTFCAADDTGLLLKKKKVSPLYPSLSLPLSAIVILSEAKDLKDCSRDIAWYSEFQILRFAQDDNSRWKKEGGREGERKRNRKRRRTAG